MSPRLDQLTSLRFFAALAVLSSHLWPLAEEPNPLQPVAQHLFHEGYAGVSFFFMLSGYILAHTYGARLRAGAISRRKYLALRIARIAPLHWLCAAPFAAAMLWTAGTRALPHVAVNLAMWQSWVPASTWYFSLDAPSWSLSDELFFYTCFAGLAFLAPRMLAAVALALLAGDAAMVAQRIAGGHGLAFAGDAPTLTHWLTYICPLTRLADFAVGMWLHHAALRPTTRARATLAEAGALMALFAGLIALPLAGVPEAARMQLAYLPVMALVVAVYARGGGAIAGWLARARWLVLLGDASFTLYLIHLPIIQFVFARWEAMDDPPPVLATAAGVTAAAVILSIAVYRWMETPLLRASRRGIDRVFAV